MGAWGFGIFEDDFASDLRMEFEEALEEGLTLEQSTQRVLEQNADVIEEDEDDGPTVYLALASLQLEHQALQPAIRDRALEIINNGLGLDRWAEEGGETLEARKQVLTELKAKLS